MANLKFLRRRFVQIKRAFCSASALLLLTALMAGAANPRAQGTLPADNRQQTMYSIDDGPIEGLQEFFPRTLAATEKQFRGRQGHISGFGAGTTYPQIWLRDSATAIPVARYYYPMQFLSSWIEEHLVHQRVNGSLNDWIAAGSRTNFLSGAPRAKDVYRSQQSTGSIIVSADKNTTEADQETSAVDAAHQVFQIQGEARWLTKTINGVSIIHRLDRSLTYLLKSRFDRQHGLVTNAFTADWGDVSPVYADQRAIYLDSKTPVVAGLYTNALFYRAALQISEMHFATGNLNRAAYWKKIAAMVKRNINKFMWQEERGFYRMHIQLTPGRKQLDNSNIFAMGGNALAALTAVADDRQAARIFEVAAQRQREYGFSTIAGSLLPPFPKGFFIHGAVNDEYEYQNGGQWDWFAARLLLAEFERGDARRAANQLTELAAKAAGNNGLFEWHTRDGKGMGSPNFMGSAGAFAAAVFQGLFGVDLAAESLTLKIRLDTRSARLNLHEPASGRHVYYEYRYFPDRAKAVLSYQSNASGNGTICILLPLGTQTRQVSSDGRPREFQTEKIGKDQYSCFVTDWSHHDVEIQLAVGRP